MTLKELMEELHYCYEDMDELNKTTEDLNASFHAVQEMKANLSSQILWIQGLIKQEEANRHEDNL